MGPFQWTVWLAITAVYMLGIFPLAFSEKHTLRPLLKNPEEIENMFWYVYGTFTNCFTFMGSRSWSKAEKTTTKLLVGFYWLFTIIITACYSGSIIAFVTLPIFPSVVDSVEQLISGGYQIGTLATGEWPHLFKNSSDPRVEKLIDDLDLVPDIQSKRQIPHIAKECFVPFNIAIAFPKNSVYSEIFNYGIMKIIEAGLYKKLKADVEWAMMRSATGKLLAANSKTAGLKILSYEDRALTLDDTQGMFLLLGAGFLMGTASLISEIVGGCFNYCKSRFRKRKDSDASIESNPRFHERRIVSRQDVTDYCVDKLSR
nr:unnamed protein product [Callosobruchus chinensis]